MQNISGGDGEQNNLMQNIRHIEVFAACGLIGVKGFFGMVAEF
jgi:hypothetical protein